MAKPIRLSLLIHTVDYLKYTGEDDTWGGNENYAPAVKIERVRVEPKKTVVSNGNGESLVMQTLLFHDAVHSTPVVFKEKSKVIFNGKEMIVSKVAEFYDRSSLHHVEVLIS
ncbi:putative minor capsid protein [Bacillus pseudomycoides]|uniref:putative minor capsid protein n=1 Tax=Bacillus pseudomycoides TaxID=64104 RepID=UPI003D2208C5